MTGKCFLDIPTHYLRDSGGTETPLHILSKTTAVEQQQQLHKQEEKSLPQKDLYMQMEEMPLPRSSSLKRVREGEEEEDRTAKKKEKSA